MTDDDNNTWQSRISRPQNSGRTSPSPTISEIIGALKCLRKEADKDVKWI